jgi:hypothetical protein
VVPSLASQSALSFPGCPAWAFSQDRVTPFLVPSLFIHVLHSRVVLLDMFIALIACFPGWGIWGITSVFDREVVYCQEVLDLGAPWVLVFATPEE